MTAELRVVPVPGLPEVRPGDDLAGMVAAACEAAIGLRDGDVVVVTQKVVSKAEGRLVEIDPEIGHRPIVEAESVRILRRRGDLIIAETEHGFVCANAGVDLSNVEAGQAALLPEDPDRSARRIRDALTHRFGVEVAVIVSDTFGRPWREGLVDVALGSAGFAPIDDIRGQTDWTGRELAVTTSAAADQLAAAAGMLMLKDAGIPAVWIEGYPLRGEGRVKDTLRDPEKDLFR